MIGLLSVHTNAQQKISISQAITAGLANKKNIVAGKLDITISQLQTQALYRKYWPQVSASYSYLFNPILQTSILPIGIFNPSYPADATKSVQFGTKWTQSAGITATQPLLDLSIQRHINEAKLQERIAALSQVQAEYELAYTVAQAYIEIYLQESKIRSLLADTNRTYISYTLLKNKFDEKRLLKSDLNRSKINHNNAVQLYADGIATLIEDKVYLLYLMGAHDIRKWDFEIDTSFAGAYRLQAAVDTTALDQLPDLQELALQSQLTSLQARSEKSKQLPTINFKGYLGANQFTNSFNPMLANSWFGQSYLGLEVKVPLLFGESTRNKIQQLEIQSSQYQLQKEDKALQYAKDTLTARLRMKNLKTQLTTQEENIALSSESIRIFQDRVLEGQESASSLNSEEADLQLLKANYETNKKQWWVYWLTYLKASGQLSILWK
jgi:outer membrane protein TolC